MRAMGMSYGPKTKETNWASFSALALFMPSSTNIASRSRQRILNNGFFSQSEYFTHFQSSQATVNHCPFTEGLLWFSHHAKCSTNFVYSLTGTIISVPQMKSLTLRGVISSSSSIAITVIYTDELFFRNMESHVISWILKQVCKLRTVNTPISQMKKLRLRKLTDVPKAIECIT